MLNERILSMKRLTALLLTIALGLMMVSAKSQASLTVIAPQWPVPDYVTRLLEIASEELGYQEGSHGYTKYGEWAGNPYAQWCAEYLCWCVDQVDQRYGTQLLKQVYPLYSGTNVGKNWFISQGRYISRNGYLEDWGYQWMRDDDDFITTGTYIPQPGDWVFFTWTGGTDTDHVAMVEKCTRNADGNVTIHVLEGNTPNAVIRATYDLTNTRILGYGTVHDVADWTIRSGCKGEKVRQLQEKLIYLDYLPENSADGIYGGATVEAVKAFQTAHGIRPNGIANIETQRTLVSVYAHAQFYDPNSWIVIDDE